MRTKTLSQPKVLKIYMLMSFKCSLSVCELQYKFWIFFLFLAGFYQFCSGSEECQGVNKSLQIICSLIKFIRLLYPTYIVPLMTCISIHIASWLILPAPRSDGLKKIFNLLPHLIWFYLTNIGWPSSCRDHLPEPR